MRNLLPGPSAACSCSRRSPSRSPWSPPPPRLRPTNAVAPAITAAMQRDLGLSSAQLSQYLKIERLAAMQQKTFAKRAGPPVRRQLDRAQRRWQFQLVVATTSIRSAEGPRRRRDPQRAQQPGLAQRVQGAAR